MLDTFSGMSVSPSGCILEFDNEHYPDMKLMLFSEELEFTEEG